MAHFPDTQRSSPDANHGFDELDVFKTLRSGEVVWCGSFSSLESAKARINELLVTEPGEYFIHSYPSGQEFFFKTERPALESHNSEGL